MQLHVAGKIENVKHTWLLDTGSDVTCTYKLSITWHWWVAPWPSTDWTLLSKWNPFTLYRWNCDKQCDTSSLKTQCVFTCNPKLKCRSHYGYGYPPNFWFLCNWLGSSDTYSWRCQVDLMLWTDLIVKCLHQWHCKPLGVPLKAPAYHQVPLAFHY